MTNYSKIYVTSTSHAPSQLSLTDTINVVNLIMPLVGYELTIHNTVANYLSSTIFRNAMRDDWFICINEYGQDIDMFVNKFPDNPNVGGGSGGTVYPHTLEFTGDNVTDVWTLTHNRNTNNFIAKLYTLEDLGSGLVQVETEALIRGNGLDPFNAIDVIFTYPPTTENFRLVALVFEV